MPREMINVRGDHIMACKVGNTVYVGGHGGGREPDIESQTERAFTNIEGTLKAAGAGLGDIVKLTIYITQRDHLPRMVEKRKTFFAERNIPLPPGRTTVIAELGSPDSLIEMDAIAVID